MLSAAEAELGALYINAKEAAYIQQILSKMGHPQPTTPIQTDNLTVEGVINNKIQPKRTKAMDISTFIGYKIVRRKVNSEFTGGREKTTSQIILQNTTHQHII